MKNLLSSKALLAILLILLMSLLFRLIHVNFIDINELLSYFENKGDVVSILTFFCVYLIFVIFGLPALQFNLAAGFYFGWFVGALISTLAVTLGGCVSFCAARFVFGQPLDGGSNSNKLNFLKRSIDQGGWKFVAFARINPIFPTGLLNYLLGLTSIKLSSFIITTLIFIYPPAAAFAYLGSIFSTFNPNEESLNIIINKILIFSFLITIIYFIKNVLKNLNKDVYK